MRNTIIILLLGMFLFSACGGEDFLYKKKSSVEVKGWEYENAKVFDFEIKDTSTLYSILLDVQHTTDYPYQNFYYLVQTDFPSGKHLEQVVSSDLADKAGVWHGDCSGKNCTAHINLQKKAKFNELGKHTITIQQHSRDTLLTGIRALVLKLQEK